MHIKHILLIIFYFSFFQIHAQAIDNQYSNHHLTENKSVRFRYDNDFFTATDRYYTQGIGIEIIHPSIKGFIPERALASLANSEMKYGISIEHNGYTPTSIRHNEILEHDRPFAACLFFKTFKVSTDTIRKQRMVATLSFGLIGQGAGGKEMQETIHRWLKNIQPLGWSHQIRNDVILNYQIDYEHRIFHCKSALELSALASGRAGTLSDKLNVGLVGILGRYSSSYKRSEKKNLEIYVYGNPMIGLIGYDATLQGGLLNHSSPYIIIPSQIERLVFSGNAGIVFRLKDVYLEYFQSFITKEFSSGEFHRWGGIQLGGCF